MWRSVAGMPRSENSVVTWCSDSGDRLQKSHCMVLLRNPVAGSRFCEWMKSLNLSASRTKNTGVLLPTRSQLPCAV
jgi:hypothetical protein